MVKGPMVRLTSGDKEGEKRGQLLQRKKGEPLWEKGLK